MSIASICREYIENREEQLLAAEKRRHLIALKRRGRSYITEEEIMQLKK